MSSQQLISVRVRPEIVQRLKLLSQVMHRSSSYIAAEALEEYLDLHEWQVEAIQEGIEAVAKNEVVDFEIVKREWKKDLEDPSN